MNFVNVSDETFIHLLIEMAVSEPKNVIEFDAVLNNNIKCVRFVVIFNYSRAYRRELTWNFTVLKCHVFHPLNLFQRYKLNTNMLPTTAGVQFRRFVVRTNISFIACNF